MDAILFPILGIIVNFITFILVLRTWLEFCGVNANLPLSQSLIRLTQPMLKLFGRSLYFKNINLVALLLAIVIEALLFVLADYPVSYALLIGVFGVVKTLGQILFFTTLIRALMSWITQGNHPLDLVVAQITEPVLAKIRQILPRTGMIDFSVMVLGIILLVANNLMTQYFGGLWLVA